MYMYSISELLHTDANILSLISQIHFNDKRQNITLSDGHIDAN